MFALQSQYDGWQLGSVLANGSDPEAVAEMGVNITGRLNASVLAPHPSNGGFLDSCGALSCPSGRLSGLIRRSVRPL